MHQGSAGIGGSAVEVELQAADLRQTRDTVLGLIAADTGQPADRIFEDSRHDHWYTAVEAREYGFVDAIAETFAQLMPSRKRPFGLRPADPAAEAAAGRTSQEHRRRERVMSSYTIPNVIAEHPRGDRIMDVYSHLLTERIVVLGTAIDPGVANTLTAQLIYLEAHSPDQEINLYINCEGGDIPSMLAIYDTMQYIQAPVATTCVGQAVAAGAVLLAAGAPGRRAMLPHARVILHQPAASGQGPIPDLILAADEVVRLRGEFESVLSAHTGQSVETLRADTDRDRIFTAQAALDYGLIDQILTDRDLTRRSRARRLRRPWRGRREARGGGGRAADVSAAAGGAGEGAGPHAGEAAQVLRDRERQVGQGGVERAREGGDHLARRLLAPALDLGQVLRRDPGPLGGLRERLVAVGAQRPQAAAEHLPPQRLRRLTPVREDPDDLSHDPTVESPRRRRKHRSP